MPNIYRVSCPSNCGSYFAPYLKALTILADSREEALALARQWLKDNGRTFLYGEEKWKVYCVNRAEGVIETIEEPDY